MNGNLMKTKIKTSVIFLLLVLFLISLSIMLTLNVSAIQFWLSHARIAGVNKTQMMRDYRHLLIYLQLPFQSSFHFQFIPSSKPAMSHFLDVKKMFLFNEVICIVTGAIVVPTLVKQKRQHQLWKLILPLQYFLVLLLMLGFLLVINFEKFFIKFHQMTFNNNDWIFNPNTDPIINVLTENFFTSSVIIFVGLFLIEVLILIIIARRNIER